MTDWGNVAFVFAGAVIAAGATFSGQYFNTRQQTRHAAEQRERHFTDVQREAAVKFLSSVDLLLAEGDELRRVLEIRELNELIDVVYSRYYARWAEFVASRAELALAGSKEAKNSSPILLEAMYKFVNSVDDWYERRRPPKDELTYIRCYRRAVDARNSFAKAVGASFERLITGGAA